MQGPDKEEINSIRLTQESCFQGWSEYALQKYAEAVRLREMNLNEKWKRKLGLPATIIN